MFAALKNIFSASQNSPQRPAFITQSGMEWCKRNIDKYYNLDNLAAAQSEGFAVFEQYLFAHCDDFCIGHIVSKTAYDNWKYASKHGFMFEKNVPSFWERLLSLSPTACSN